MVVDIMRGAKLVVVPAVADKFLVFVDQEVAHVQVLMGREAVAALEIEVGGLLVPRASGVDVPGPGAHMRATKAVQVALLDGRIAPKKFAIWPTNSANKTNRCRRG